jgi:hypothetical protein
VNHAALQVLTQTLRTAHRHSCILARDCGERLDRHGYSLRFRQIVLGRRINLDHWQARDIAESLRLAYRDATALEVIAAEGTAGQFVRLEARDLVRLLLCGLEAARRLPRNRKIVGLLLYAIETGQQIYHVPKDPLPLGGTESRNRALVRRQAEAQPVRAARRVAGLAARVLPAMHRARYRDEYRSELHDIASTGASWLEQVAYAIRLLNRSWELRYELRRPAARRVRS